MSPLADYYDLFRLLRSNEIDQLIKKEKTNIDEADVLENYDQDLKHIFDMLGIDLYCCRGHLTAAKDFYDYWKAS